MRVSWIRSATCLALALGFVVSTAGAAQAKQCVWNKAGFVLDVKWYHPDHVQFLGSQRKDGLRDLGYALTPGARPAQVDRFPLAQGRCIDRGDGVQYFAVLSAVGGAVAADVIRTTALALTAAGAGAVAAAGCVGTAGAGCFATVAGAGALVGSAAAAIPGGKDLFGVTVPPTDYWVDVWGTVFSPQFASGHGISGRI